MFSVFSFQSKIYTKRIWGGFFWQHRNASINVWTLWKFPLNAACLLMWRFIFSQDQVSLLWLTGSPRVTVPVQYIVMEMHMLQSTSNIWNSQLCYYSISKWINWLTHARYIYISTVIMQSMAFAFRQISTGEFCF